MNELGRHVCGAAVLKAEAAVVTIAIGSWEANEQVKTAGSGPAFTIRNLFACIVEWRKLHLLRIFMFIIRTGVLLIRWRDLLIRTTLCGDHACTNLFPPPLFDLDIPLHFPPLKKILLSRGTVQCSLKCRYLCYSSNLYLKESTPRVTPLFTVTRNISHVYNIILVKPI
jgi:hypothetical protein